MWLRNLGRACVSAGKVFWEGREETLTSCAVSQALLLLERDTITFLTNFTDSNRDEMSVIPLSARVHGFTQRSEAQRLLIPLTT